MKPRVLADVARIAAVCLAAGAALGSASSSQNAPPPYPPPVAPYGGQVTRPPPPVPMDASSALGLWRSSWGAVKIEPDAQRGAGFVHGVFVYTQDGREVVGYFGGRLEGNVLDLTWEEPAQSGPLQGAGYLVFDPAGQRFAGRWWTNARDRAGEWNGSRQPPGNGPQALPPVPGDTDGDAPPSADPYAQPPPVPGS
jgi:hypothetical protein